MPRPPRAQLAINAPPELLERLRGAAAARGTTITRVVLDAIQAHLDAPAGAAPQAGLVEELARINARLDALERQRPMGGSGITQMSEAAASDQGQAPPDRGRSMAISDRLEGSPDGAVTGAQLAGRLGLARNTVNSWATKHRPGDVYEGWRLIGKAPPPRGGPERWMFVPAA